MSHPRRTVRATADAAIPATIPEQTSTSHEPPGEASPARRFSPATRAWFDTSFPSATLAQARGWPAIADGDHTLILAPTGSGKTLTAFMWALDQLLTTEPSGEPKTHRTRVVYLSPLRALAVDVDKNLRAPLGGIRLAAERLGETVRDVEVGVRTGDTSPKERQRMARHPPDILITTPESLYLYLTSRARETLAGVETVIIDEIHAMVPTKRGAHLALALERLEEVTDRSPQRIGLSATQRPLDEVARFLGGYGEDVDEDTGEVRLTPRPVTIVDAGVTKELDLEVVIPVEDMANLGEQEPQAADPSDPLAGLTGPTRTSIWPAIHPRLLDLVNEHHSTLVFVNARRLAERLAARLNELEHLRLLREDGLDPDDPEALARPVPELVMAHHGSLSRERRIDIEDRLKSGQLRGLVATSSLELGIDMGAVDLVVQVESPGAVSRGLQRVGRAGHQVGQASRGRIFPKYRGDLLETAVVVQRMHDGQIEATRYPRNPLDVLAQHVVAMAAMDEWEVPALARVVRRAAPFHEMGDEVLEAVLDLLAGRYPSEEFSELRPRIVWDRVGDTIRGRQGAQRLAVTNPGTIPDRGLFGVFLPDGTRVGELDEEMVHESRTGETFVLGASTWRIEDITHERVVVTPAPGQPGKLPFWRGDGPGRPYELGAALGAFCRTFGAQADAEGEARDAAVETLRRDHALDDWAADNLLGYLSEQLEAVGHLPDDRTIVVERFRDEIGDWRICVLSPFGAQVHAPWTMAMEARLSEAGVEVEVLWTDDGIVLRMLDTTMSESEMDRLVLDALSVEPEEIEELVTAQVAGTAMFTTSFREAAGRALLLPKRRPGQRTALWQQRQRAANLLKVASKYPTFPILLEATRECLQDTFDLPALKSLLGDIRSRKVRLRPVVTDRSSPFASSLLFSWVGTYLYEYDAPLAERRAAALSLDRDLLRELLGGDELRELVDAGVLADLELELQLLVDGRRARDVDELHDVLRRLGPQTLAELDARSTDALAVEPAVRELVEQRRAIEVHVAGEARVAAAEDAGRLRDALGVAIPVGLPGVFTDPVPRPLEDLAARFARTHGPFLAQQLAKRLGLPVERARGALDALVAEDRLLVGEFRPGGVEREFVDPDVLRTLRRRSLASLRSEVEPVDGAALARFQVDWHGVTGSRPRGIDALLDAVARLQGAAIPASVLERDVLAMRVRGYREGDLDQLLAAGEVAWIGAGGIGANDGRLVLCFRDQVPLLAPDPPDEPPDGEVHERLRAHLGARGASFWPDLLRASGTADQEVVLDALWDLVWAGEVTNDTYAPVRALRSGRAVRTRAGRSRGRRPRPGQLRVAGPPRAAGRWSLVEWLREPVPGAGPADPTHVARARAEQLLERYGVLTREAALAEGVTGGFAGVYPVLKVMEETGKVRRGYFVEGLGAAQFAAPGAVDRLRGHREAPGGAAGWGGAGPPSTPNAVGSGAPAPADAAYAAAGNGAGPGGWDAGDARPDRTAWARRRDRTADHGDDGVVVLAATDPAQPYGAALPWPEVEGRPARAAGAYVVLGHGRPLAYLERGGRTLVTFPAATEQPGWASALARLVHDGHRDKVDLQTVDGEPAAASDHRPALETAGFRVGHKGLVLRGA